MRNLSSVPHRSLKTQPIKGRLGEVFNHPDIASSHIEDVSTAVYFMEVTVRLFMFHANYSNDKNSRKMYFQLFADVLVSNSNDFINRTRTFSRSHTTTLEGFTLAEVKQAWASSKLFANRPMPRRSSSCYSPVMEVR